MSRLQKKVVDLEAKLNEAEREIQSMQAAAGFASPGAAPGSGLFGKGDLRSADAVPRSPAKFTLTGHRFPVTGVVFRPHHNVLSQQARIPQLKFGTLKRVTSSTF